MFKLLQSKGHLRNKILSMLILVGVAPLIVLGALSLFSLNSFHRLDVASIENNLINQKAEEIKSFLDNIAGTLQLQVGFEQTSDIELSQQTFLLKQLLAEFPAFEEVSFINLAGHETTRLSREYPDGVAQDELRDQGLIKKFVDAQSGKSYIGQVYFTLKGPMVTVSSPVINRNNIIISVLTGEVNLSDIQKMIGNSVLGETGYLYVVNNDGFLVANSRTDKNSLSTLKSIGFVNSIVTGQKDIVNNRYQSFWNEPVVASGKYISDIGLAVIAEWPIQDADRVVITVRDQIVTISLFVLFVTLFLSILFADKIVKPIKMLERGTQLIAEGKFSEPIHINTGDEIEELGTSFNTMMDGLKRLEELKKEFVFIAAHELKTPVAVIRGYLAMIMNGNAGPVSDSVKELMSKIVNANQRLVQLVNDLLQIARAEAGKLTIKVASVDIVKPIQDIVKELKVLADEKKINIIYEASSLPNIMGDSDRLKEIMVNLIGNAIKYTLGSGTVTISHEINGGELITNIRDTGLGISDEAQKKLFEKFYRVQTDQTRDISGTGLGLFIVKQIVEKMGGRIWVTSQEGQGSVFSFSLLLA